MFFDHTGAGRTGRDRAGASGQHAPSHAPAPTTNTVAGASSALSAAMMDALIAERAASGYRKSAVLQAPEHRIGHGLSQQAQHNIHRAPPQPSSMQFPPPLTAIPSQSPSQQHRKQQLSQQHVSTNTASFHHVQHPYRRDQQYSNRLHGHSPQFNPALHDLQHRQPTHHDPPAHQAMHLHCHHFSPVAETKHGQHGTERRHYSAPPTAGTSPSMGPSPTNDDLARVLGDPVSGRNSVARGRVDAVGGHGSSATLEKVGAAQQHSVSARAMAEALSGMATLNAVAGAARLNIPPPPMSTCVPPHATGAPSPPQPRARPGSGHRVDTAGMNSASTPVKHSGHAGEMWTNVATGAIRQPAVSVRTMADLASPFSLVPTEPEQKQLHNGVESTWVAARNAPDAAVTAVAAPSDIRTPKQRRTQELLMSRAIAKQTDRMVRSELGAAGTQKNSEQQLEQKQQPQPRLHQQQPAKYKKSGEKRENVPDGRVGVNARGISDSGGLREDHVKGGPQSSGSMGVGTVFSAGEGNKARLANDSETNSPFASNFESRSGDDSNVKRDPGDCKKIESENDQSNKYGEEILAKLGEEGDQQGECKQEHARPQHTDKEQDNKQSVGDRRPNLDYSLKRDGEEADLGSDDAYYHQLQQAERQEPGARLLPRELLHRRHDGLVGLAMGEVQNKVGPGGDFVSEGKNPKPPAANRSKFENNSGQQDLFTKLAYDAARKQCEKREIQGRGKIERHQLGNEKPKSQYTPNGGLSTKLEEVAAFGQPENMENPFSDSGKAEPVHQNGGKNHGRPDSTFECPRVEEESKVHRLKSPSQQSSSGKERSLDRVCMEEKKGNKCGIVKDDSWLEEEKQAPLWKSFVHDLTDEQLARFKKTVDNALSDVSGGTGSAASESEEAVVAGKALEIARKKRSSSLSPVASNQRKCANARLPENAVSASVDEGRHCHPTNTNEPSRQRHGNQDREVYAKKSSGAREEGQRCSAGRPVQQTAIADKQGNFIEKMTVGDTHCTPCEAVKKTANETRRRRRAWEPGGSRMSPSSGGWQRDKETTETAASGVVSHGVNRESSSSRSGVSAFRRPSQLAGTAKNEDSCCHLGQVASGGNQIQPFPTAPPYHGSSGWYGHSGSQPKHLQCAVPWEDSLRAVAPALDFGSTHGTLAPLHGSPPLSIRDVSESQGCSFASSPSSQIISASRDPVKHGSGRVRTNQGSPKMRQHHVETIPKGLTFRGTNRRPKQEHHKCKEPLVMTKNGHPHSNVASDKAEYPQLSTTNAVQVSDPPERNENRADNQKYTDTNVPLPSKVSESRTGGVKCSPFQQGTHASHANVSPATAAIVKDVLLAARKKGLLSSTQRDSIRNDAPVGTSERNIATDREDRGSEECFLGMIRPHSIMHEPKKLMQVEIFDARAERLLYVLPSEAHALEFMRASDDQLGVSVVSEILEKGGGIVGNFYIRYADKEYPADDSCCFLPGDGRGSCQNNASDCFIDREGDCVDHSFMRQGIIPRKDADSGIDEDRRPIKNCVSRSSSSVDDRGIKRTSERRGPEQRFHGEKLQEAAVSSTAQAGPVAGLPNSDFSVIEQDISLKLNVCEIRNRLNQYKWPLESCFAFGRVEQMVHLCQSQLQLQQHQSVLHQGDLETSKFWVETLFGVERGNDESLATSSIDVGSCEYAKNTDDNGMLRRILRLNPKLRTQPLGVSDSPLLLVFYHQHRGTDNRCQEQNKLPSTAHLLAMAHVIIDANQADSNIRQQYHGSEFLSEVPEGVTGICIRHLDSIWWHDLGQGHNDDRSSDNGGTSFDLATGSVFSSLQNWIRQLLRVLFSRIRRRQAYGFDLDLEENGLLDHAWWKNVLVRVLPGKYGIRIPIPTDESISARKAPGDSENVTEQNATGNEAYMCVNQVDDVQRTSRTENDESICHDGPAITKSVLCERVVPFEQSALLQCEDQLVSLRHAGRRQTTPSTRTIGFLPLCFFYNSALRNEPVAIPVPPCFSEYEDGAGSIPDIIIDEKKVDHDGLKESRKIQISGSDATEHAGILRNTVEVSNIVDVSRQGTSHSRDTFRGPTDRHPSSNDDEPTEQHVIGEGKRSAQPIPASNDQLETSKTNVRGKMADQGCIQEDGGMVDVESTCTQLQYHNKTPVLDGDETLCRGKDRSSEPHRPDLTQSILSHFVDIQSLFATDTKVDLKIAGFKDTCDPWSLLLEGERTGDGAGNENILHHPNAPLSEIWVAAGCDTDGQRGSLQERSFDADKRNGLLSNMEGRIAEHSTHDTLHSLPPSANIGANQLDKGGSILGRRLVWDEGYYSDTEANLYKVSGKGKDDSIEEYDCNRPSGRSTIRYEPNGERGLQMFAVNSGTHATQATSRTNTSDSMEEDPVTFVDRKGRELPVPDRKIKASSSSKEPSAGNQTGLAGQGTKESEIAKNSTGSSSSAVASCSGMITRTSAGKGADSVRMSQVITELAYGKLDPHTLIQCEAYRLGPEFRFISTLRESTELSDSVDSDESDSDEKDRGESSKSSDATKDTDIGALHKRYHEHLIKDEELLPTLGKVAKIKGTTDHSPKLLRYLQDSVQPFAIRMSPDASFLIDLHVHLAHCEVIGFLGGRWVPEERCIYIQAAFPCRSTDRSDSGATDVEMDPVSQVVAKEAISKKGLAVCGWYHSHPKFRPDPSVTDIDNQASYQRLMQDDQSFSKSNSRLGGKVRNVQVPFVGLIVGTYAGRNPDALSVWNWFHVTPKSHLPDSRGDSIVSTRRSSGSKRSVNFPRKLDVTYRIFRRNLGHLLVEKNTVSVTADQSVTHDEEWSADARSYLTRTGTALRLRSNGLAIKHWKREKLSFLNGRSGAPQEGMKILSTSPELGLSGQNSKVLSNSKKTKQSETDAKATSTEQEETDAKANNSERFRGHGDQTTVDQEMASRFTPQLSLSRKSSITGKTFVEGLMIASQSDHVMESDIELCPTKSNGHCETDSSIVSGENTNVKFSTSRRTDENGTPVVPLSLLFRPVKPSQFEQGGNGETSSFENQKGENLPTSSHQSESDGDSKSRASSQAKLIGLSEQVCHAGGDVKKDSCRKSLEQKPKLKPKEIVAEAKALKRKRSDVQAWSIAHPLPFCQKELERLHVLDQRRYRRKPPTRSKEMNGITIRLEDRGNTNSQYPVDSHCEVEIADIIWKAVEREQMRGNVSSSENCFISLHSESSSLFKPASPQSIRRLLLLPDRISAAQRVQHKFRKRRRGQYAIDGKGLDGHESGCQKGTSQKRNNHRNGNDEKTAARYHVGAVDDGDGNDAAVIYGIDAVLFHYSSNSHRVNVHDAWIGNGTKMGKGTKICACLLRWTRHMQLFSNSRRNRLGMKLSLCAEFEDIAWDDISGKEKLRHKRRRPSSEISFVAEVMRLLAAYWREASERPVIPKKKRRGRRKTRGATLSKKKVPKSN